MLVIMTVVARRRKTSSALSIRRNTRKTKGFSPDGGDTGGWHNAISSTMKGVPTTGQKQHPQRLSLAPLELWTLEETSLYLREDERTTRRRVARGELPVIRLPGSRRLLFVPEQVRQFAAANLTGVA